MSVLLRLSLGVNRMIYFTGVKLIFAGVWHRAERHVVHPVQMEKSLWKVLWSTMRIYILKRMMFYKIWHQFVLFKGLLRRERELQKSKVMNVWTSQSLNITEYEHQNVWTSQSMNITACESIFHIYTNSSVCLSSTRILVISQWYCQDSHILISESRK